MDRGQEGGICLEAIQFNGVSFSYGKKEYTIKNTDITLNKNEFTAIVGENGSGKTTLGKLMAGIVKPSRGKVLIFGKDSMKISLGEIGTQIGYLFQNPDKQLFAATVEEEIGFTLALKRYEKEKIKNSVDAMLELFQLQHVRNVFPFHLSHGEKQRLALAATIANAPQYLILDEPTTGLDVQRKKILSQVLENLLNKGIGMTVISHDKAFVMYHAARILEISGGEIIGDLRK